MRLLLPLAAVVVSFAVRLVAPAQLAPFDELYHWKRVAWSVEHFPRVLDFDPDRGLTGAWCPWPPLYDLFAAAVALLFGSLDVVLWIPPVLTSLLVGVVVFFVARLSFVAGLVAAVWLSFSPFLVFVSSRGDIDHHFLEGFLVLGIVGGVLVSRLAVPLIVALFVQTALIISAGLAALCSLWLCGEKLFTTETQRAQSFGIAAVAVAVYRLTRPESYPNSPWFLGWNHVALLAAAAVTLALWRRPVIALIAGCIVALTAPGTMEGLRFFGGDAWLSTIDEFQPIWRPLAGMPNYIAVLLPGAIAGIALLRRHTTLAIFTLAYIAATIVNRRFIVIAVVLTAVAIALAFRKVLVVAIVIAIPPMQLVSWWMSPTPPSVETAHFLRAAHFLREHGKLGRAIVPWSYGHMFDVIGQRPVVLDNFGTMPDPQTFRVVHELLAGANDDAVGAFCDRYGIRYIVFEKRKSRPLNGFRPVFEDDRLLILERWWA